MDYEQAHKLLIKQEYITIPAKDVLNFFQYCLSNNTPGESIIAKTDPLTMQTNLKLV